MMCEDFLDVLKKAYIFDESNLENSKNELLKSITLYKEYVKSDVSSLRCPCGTLEIDPQFFFYLIDKPLIATPELGNFFMYELGYLVTLLNLRNRFNVIHTDPLNLPLKNLDPGGIFRWWPLPYYSLGAFGDETRGTKFSDELFKHYVEILKNKDKKFEIEPVIYHFEDEKDVIKEVYGVEELKVDEPCKYTIHKDEDEKNKNKDKKD